MADDAQNGLSGIFKSPVEPINDEENVKVISNTLVEYRLHVMHGLFKELRRDLEKMKEDYGSLARVADRLYQEQESRDKRIGRIWAAVIGAIMSVIVGVVLYLLTGGKGGGGSP